MGKQSQRKRQMYRDGFKDGEAGRRWRWKRHPLMRHYLRGYRAGEKELAAKRRAKTWWFRVLRWLCQKFGAR